MGNEFFTREADPVSPGLPLVVAIAGLSDVGAAVSVLGQHLMETASSRRLGFWDSDQLYDFRTQRGVAHLNRGRFVDASLPGLALSELTDADGRSFLLLFGPEPALSWLKLTESIVDLARDFGVSQVITVAGAPWAVPHTRPVGVMAHGTNPMTVARFGHPMGEVTVPVTVPALLELQGGAAGLEVTGLVVRVPQYLANGVYPPAAAALLEALDSLAGVNVPLERLDGANVHAEVSAQMRRFPPLAALIRALEDAYDQHADGDDPVTALPSGDELAAQIEQYLAGQ